MENTVEVIHSVSVSKQFVQTDVNDFLQWDTCEQTGHIKTGHERKSGTSGNFLGKGKRILHSEAIM